MCWKLQTQENSFHALVVIIGCILVDIEVPLSKSPNFKIFERSGSESNFAKNVYASLLGAD